MKTVISVGFAKCGTTTLHDAFAAMKNARVPRRSKEIVYFAREPQPSTEGYLSEFFADGEAADLDSTVLFEASPPYASSRTTKEFRAVLEEIKRCVPDTIFILNMRQPLKRAYSHYLHDLQAYSVFGDRAFRLRKDVGESHITRRPFSTGFLEASFNYINIVPSYFGTLKAIVEIFGADQVLPFYLEKDVKAFHGFMSLLSQKTGLDLDGQWIDQPAPWSRGGQSFPDYIYATEEMTVECDGGQIRLKPRDLLAASAFDAYIIRNVPMRAGRRTQLAQYAWSRGVDAETAARMMEAQFAPDIRKTIKYARSLGWETRSLEGYLTNPGAYKLDLATSSAIRSLSKARLDRLRIVEYQPK